MRKRGKKREMHCEDYHFEMKRKTFHVLTGLALLEGIRRNWLTAGRLAAMAAAVLTIGWISRNRRIPGIALILQHLEREENMRGLPAKGTVGFLSGLALTVFLFSRNTACAALAILIAGDSVSNLVGRRWGKTLHPCSQVKKLEGHLAGTLVGALLACPFAGFRRSLAAASLAMFAEGCDFLSRDLSIDDNFTVPIVAGTVLKLLEPKDPA